MTVAFFSKNLIDGFPTFKVMRCFMKILWALLLVGVSCSFSPVGYSQEVPKLVFDDERAEMFRLSKAFKHIFMTHSQVLEMCASAGVLSGLTVYGMSNYDEKEEKWVPYLYVTDKTSVSYSASGCSSLRAYILGESRESTTKYIVTVNTDETSPLKQRSLIGGVLRLR